MARYDIRDLFGHWVKIPPHSNEDGMCPHACCRGKRKHPDNFQVIMSKSELHQASESDLVRHYDRVDVGDSPRAVRQVIGELQRREDMAARRTGRKAAKASQAEQYRAYLEHDQVTAENATRGNMLSKRGRAKKIDPRALWTMGDAARQQYASEELLEYFARHPVVTEDEFSGSDRDRARGAARRRESRLYGVY